MKKVIISSSCFLHRGKSTWGFEVNQLIREAKNYYDKIHLVYPPHARHHFIEETRTSDIFCRDDENISDASVLIVRNTSGCEEATRLLALNLYANNCELLDPPERFNGAAATKSFMTLKGLKDKTIPSTFIAFTLQSAMELLPFIENSDLYPVVGKPSHGKQGEDVQLIKNNREAKQYIQKFYTKYQEHSTGTIFQKFIEIKKEYRVLLLDGKSLGVVEKMPSPHTIARNAGKGSNFIAVTNEAIEHYAIKYNSQKGLLGTDIAVNVNEDCYLIESNRSPQWQSFEKATGTNVAKEIMEALEKRIAVSSELF